MFDMCQFRVGIIAGERCLLWNSHGFRTFGVPHNCDWDLVVWLDDPQP